ncbi:MAG: PstS family phosphate ABC transporter substrate-binding protein [Candidatus Cloacimonadota bacterium]|nr:PstS family phosphate ABC transporter substrate-binding protein [Candidatus Cloacimonadota bacterium]
MKKKKIIQIFLGLVVLIMTISCNSRKANTVNTAGSTTVLPIVQAAAEVYMNINPGTNISVRGGGSGLGIKSIIMESIDIGTSSRKVNEQENEQIKKKQNELIETAIAIDAISIIVHKDNPINDISLKSLRLIYSGKMTNWNELGGADLEIVVISRDVSSGSFEVFNHAVLHNDLLKDNSMRLASNNAVATTISYTKGAIGYIGLGYVNDELKVLSIDEVLPSKVTAQNYEYPLTRKLFMYTTKTRSDATQDFIDFILSELGQTIVEQQGYIRIK